MKKNKFLGFVLGTVLISGCVTDQNDRTAATLIGAGVGAILGQSMSKDKNKGAAVGAMVGMVAGNIYAQALEEQEKALRTDLAGSGALIYNTGEQLIITLPEGITFDTDSAVIKPQFFSYLNSLARNLLNHSSTTVDVIGHTDNTGTPEYNLELSVLRAEAVTSNLVALGIDGSRIRAHGVGEAYPIGDNSNSFGRLQNRRVEVYIRPIKN